MASDLYFPEKQNKVAQGFYCVALEYLFPFFTFGFPFSPIVCMENWKDSEWYRFAVLTQRIGQSLDDVFNGWCSGLYNFSFLCPV